MKRIKKAEPYDFLKDVRQVVQDCSYQTQAREVE